MAQGENCESCGGQQQKNQDTSNLHLHVEIENLKQRLLEKENHIVNMETSLIAEVDRFPNGEFAALAEELLTWQDKYERLYEAHKRVQKVNQGLEDKLLKIVDKCETEKTLMAKEIATLKQRLVDTDATLACMKEENERNRNDVNLAIQLLQCKPSNFIPQRFESLPAELQNKVKLYMGSKNKASNQNPLETPRHEPKTIKVPIPTYPPTAMFYSINNKSSGDNNNKDVESGGGKPVDIVSAAIMAKILEEREKERQNVRHCVTCMCPQKKGSFDKSTQTGSISIQHKFDSRTHILKVDAYQSASPSVSSAILIERTPSTASPASSSSSLSSSSSVQLGLGRNRYNASRGRTKKHSSKLNSSECEPTGMSNILLDNVSCFHLPHQQQQQTQQQLGGYSHFTFNHHHPMVHSSSRSSSTSSSDDNSRPTETQI